MLMCSKSSHLLHTGRSQQLVVEVVCLGTLSVLAVDQHRYLQQDK
jgi:hypothetical protein